LVTNAARKKPPQRHQLDHTIHWPELLSMDITAAAKDSSSLQAVDATSRTKECAKLQAVIPTYVARGARSASTRRSVLFRFVFGKEGLVQSTV